MFDIGKKSADKGQQASGAQATQARAPQPGAGADSARRAAPATPREAAVIGPSIHIDGDLRGEEDLVIELRNNTLTIGAQGKVSADVFAHSVYVEGYMEGDLFGSERVCVRKSAQVKGNITSPRISLEDGARFKGSIEMDPQAVEAALGRRRGTPSTAAGQEQKPQQPSQSKTDGKPDAASGIKR